jgi:hypothetical protein
MICGARTGLCRRRLPACGQSAWAPPRSHQAQERRSFSRFKTSLRILWIYYTPNFDCRKGDFTSGISHRQPFPKPTANRPWLAKRRAASKLRNNHQTVVIESAEVERLVENFGPEVRGMGVWNHATDGSLEIPMSNITDAVGRLDDQVLAEAVTQLKTPEHFTDLLDTSSAAKQLIEALSRSHLQQFQSKVERFQDSTDPAEVERLRNEMSRELFGT